MRKRLFFAALLAVAAAALCFGQAGDSVTYRYGDNYRITFSGNTFNGIYGSDTMSGTFSASDSRLTLNITGGTLGRRTWTWTIVDDNTLRDQDGDRWSRGGAAQSNASPNASNANSNTLTVWSFTDELGNMTEYYKHSHPDVWVTYSMTLTEQFTARLDPVLANGRGVPDIFALESGFVRKYVEAGPDLLLDLTDIYEANKSRLLKYPVDVGTYNGKVYALSWQAAPGAMFYRRSLAKKYLGTDDPQAVQTYFADMNKFLETAAELKANSGGSCVVVSSLGDLALPAYGSRQDPWVVNGRLVIDPVMDSYLDLCKTMRDNSYEGGVEQWSEGWFDGMRGELRWNRPIEVFSYFLPTWGLHWVLKTNAPNTSGDWAMIPGPVPYRWGGTWIGAYKGTRNVAAVKEFIRYLTCDDGFLEAWAKDTGDLVSNTYVIDKIKDSYREPFLGGQNHYAEFAEMAKNVNGRLIQSTDDVIQGVFAEARDAYVNGVKTKAQALADFKAQVEWLLR